MNGATHAPAALVREPPVIHLRGGSPPLVDRLLEPIWTPNMAWPALFGVAGLGTLVFFASVGYTVLLGPGVWGNNIPVAWAFPIINFVWWIGIGHAGTFISAFLYLLNQSWRASVNRVAEAMTLFALVQAGAFPLLHLGRPWFFYWLIPYPATMGVWPQFKSTLPWDVAAVSTYFTISLLFWYLGLVPDLAAARDRAPGLWRRRVYGVFALGWTGSSRQWTIHRVAYTLLAGLAAPLVISVHSIVSLDFSITQLTGWHSTIFPPYFVIGAIHSGFAMVLLIVLPLRALYWLQDVITERHLDSMAKLLLVMGSILGFCYLSEAFIGWYSQNRFEIFVNFHSRPLGPYAPAYWAMLVANVVVPQLLWWRRVRTNAMALFLIALAVLAGMWVERFIIVVTALNEDFLPSSWATYTPTGWDWSLLLGSVAFFLLLLFAFIRFVPWIPVHEVNRLRLEREDDVIREEPDVVPPAVQPRVMGEFVSAAALNRARATVASGTAAESYTPVPIGSARLNAALPPSSVSRVALVAGVLGGVAAYAIQWAADARWYPLNAGGRPAHAVPAFMLITFETVVLCAGVAAFLAWMWQLGLPRVWRPEFEVDGFDRVSRDRFWLGIAVAGADAATTAAATSALEEAGAERVVRLEDQ